MGRAKIWPFSLTKKTKGRNEVENMFFPDIETDRLILRKFQHKDLQFIFNHFSNNDVCKYLYDNEPLRSIEEAKEIMAFYEDQENKTHNRWMIINKQDNNRMGTCGFHCWDKQNNIAEIGYDLTKMYWGQGYMTEALTSILNHGFQNLGLNRVQAFVSIENESSSKLLLKLGFKNEGIIREKHLYRGEYYDHFCFSLLKREWKES